MMSVFTFFPLFALFSIVYCLPTAENLFELSIVHINDFHSRFEETDEWGNPCKTNQTCIGGFSRMFQTIKLLKEQNPNSLVLNAGDNFQGTIWYTLLKGDVVQTFINKIPFDAYTLGNHEFDDQVNETVKYMKNLKAPIVLSNLDDSEQPEIQGLYKKSIVIEKDGRKIGIIGVLLTEVQQKSRVGKLNFLDESTSINREAERLVREENVFTNIILSHCGYELEKEMARKATGKISVIVGGHTHSLLWNGDNPPSKAEKPEGPYPTVVKNSQEKSILVVQAQSFARYVGNFTVFFNKDGTVNTWSGHPIFLAHSLRKNKEIDSELLIWKEKVDQHVNKVIGQTLTDISDLDCRRKECTLGNFITDAFVFNELVYEVSKWTNASLALVNCGSLKETIPKGNITYRQLLASTPFGNTIVVGNIKGKYIVQAMEHALNYFAEWQSRLLQVSGLKVTYDMKKPEGKRVVSIKVRCSHCKIPIYSDLNPNQEYSVALQEFITQGGDGFTMFKENLKMIRTIGKDIDIVENYLSKKSPVFVELEGRITVTGDENIKSHYRRRRFLKTK